MCHNQRQIFHCMVQEIDQTNISMHGWSGLLEQWVQCKIMTSWHPSPKTARYLRIVLPSDGGALHGKAVSTDLQLEESSGFVDQRFRRGPMVWFESQQSIAQYHIIYHDHKLLLNEFQRCVSKMIWSYSQVATNKNWTKWHHNFTSSIRQSESPKDKSCINDST